MPRLTHRVFDATPKARPKVARGKCEARRPWITHEQRRSPERATDAAPVFCRPSGPAIIFPAIQGQVRSTPPLDHSRAATQPGTGDRCSPVFCRPFGPAIIFPAIQGPRASRLPLATLFRACGARKQRWLKRRATENFIDLAERRGPKTSLTWLNDVGGKLH
jgi:hypothetical protein